jgi:exopolysaccharide biosynthesis predicted pyruvyltransferase EpsI
VILMMFPAPSRESPKEECSSVIEYLREDNEEEEDNIDYSELTIAQLPNTARQIIDTITKCKSLVRYVKKVRK